MCHRWKSIVSGQTTLSPFINGLALPYEESRGGIRGSRYTDGGGGEAPTLGPLTRFPRKRIDQISLSQSSMSPVRKFPTPPPPPPPGHGINGHYDRAQPSSPAQPVYFTVNQRPHLCSIYIRIYLFAISVNVPSKYLRSILIESWGEGTRCIYSFRDSIRIWKDIRTSFTRLLTSRSVQRFSVIFSRTQTEKEGGRESAHGRMEQLLCTGRSFDLETGYTDTEASERASVYTRRRRWDTPTCRDISVSCIISFKAFNQCRGPAVI